MSKQLYRSETSRMLFGVFGGIAEYFNIDATILRLLFVVALVLSAIFPLVIIYVAAVFIIPSVKDIQS